MAATGTSSGTRNGMRSRNASSERHLLFPVDDGRRVGAADDEILRAGQRWHQREMLVHHADAVRACVARIADRHFRAVEQDLAAIGRVEAHDAFDERGFAGAVLAEQRMNRSGLDLDRDVFERDQRAENLGHPDGFAATARASAGADACGSLNGGSEAHGRFSKKLFELDTEPNTPPCILIILIAARWLPWSVARAAILQQQAFEAAVIGFAHGGVHADVGGNAGQHDVAPAFGAAA